MDIPNDPRTAAGETERAYRPASTTWRKPSIDEKLDEALRQTFPASDAFELKA